MSAKKSEANTKRYEQIILRIFKDHWSKGVSEFVFGRDEIIEAAKRLNIAPAKNPGDVVYAFRYRRNFPADILQTQPEGLHWLILGAGDAAYRFRLNKLVHLKPNPGLFVRKLPHATPEIIEQYALTDEQALLAKIRYNRLIDTFLGLTTYSLQSHLRTKIPNYGQIEIDELYVGVDARGVQFVVPVQAKGKSDRLGVIQTIQDHIYCNSEPRYKGCVVRPVSAQFMPDGTIALFELDFDGSEVSIIQERHFQLVPRSEISPEEREAYQNRP